MGALLSLPLLAVPSLSTVGLFLPSATADDPANTFSLLT